MRGQELAEHPTEVRLGIRLHRAIDAFTDGHPAFVSSRRRIEGSMRRFSGVLVDVFYDHFLLRRFAELTNDENPTVFAQGTYAMLRQHRALLRGEIAVHLDRMIENRWLEKAQDLAGVRAVLRRITMRSKRGFELERGADELERNYDAMAADFDMFWPQVASFARDRVQELCADPALHCDVGLALP